MKQGRVFLKVVLLLFILLIMLFMKLGQRGKAPINQGRVLDDSFFLHGRQKMEQEGDSGSRKGKNGKVKMVRIVLQNQTGGYYHNKITFTSDTAFEVTRQEKKKEYKAGQKVTISAREVKTDEKPVVLQAKGNGRIKICTLKKQNIHPLYRGQMKIYREASGLLLVNALSMEQYLYAVVPSEISTSSHMEALKAQAVCARTYACNQIKGARYDKYHADLDDSVACQVYNNVPENPRVKKAVDATKSMVLTRGGKRVQVYYYSTSWGASASGKSVWNTEKDIPYLSAGYQNVQKPEETIKTPDLASEKDFKAFICKPPFKTYDTDSPWYRWKVTISLDALGQRLEEHLKQCHQSNPYLVLYEDKEGEYKKMKYQSIGQILAIQVSKRENSGLVTEILIKGKKASVKVRTQHMIRNVLAPGGEVILNKAGETFLTMLPSAAFYIQKGKQGTVHLYGGGFGHGTGMSQCGAMAMAKYGYDFKEILRHYFEGTFVTAE